MYAFCGMYIKYSLIVHEIEKIKNDLKNLLDASFVYYFVCFQTYFLVVEYIVHIKMIKTVKANK